MFRFLTLTAIALLTAASFTAQAAIPLTINHQGIVKVNALPFTGNGLFKFGFVDGTGKWLWTNDGTHIGQSAGAANPDAAVIVPCANGIYNVRLGDTALTNMTVIPSTVFDTDTVTLRVVFNDGSNGEQILAPDQPVTAVAYAYRAANADLLEGKHISELLPHGLIVMWGGSIASIPEGWALCDGTNGTPDLRDRFVVGARQDDGGIAKTNVKGSLLQTGGEHQHTLTVSEMPSHTHDEQDPGDPIDAAYGAGTIPRYVKVVSQTGATGGGQPHENCPPFYALAFIMKL